MRILKCPPKLRAWETGRFIERRFRMIGGGGWITYVLYETRFSEAWPAGNGRRFKHYEWDGGDQVWVSVNRQWR